MPPEAEQSRDSAERIGGSSVVLTTLTNEAINAYMAGGNRAMTLRSTVGQAADGLHVDTVNQTTGERHNLVVSGQSQVSHGLMSEQLTGAYDIRHTVGSRQWTDRASIDINSSNFDRADRMRASIMFRNPQGELLSGYNPATMVPVPGRTYSNGDQVLFGRLTDGTNCQAQNFGSPGNRRFECNYQVTSPNGVLSLSETKHQYGDNTTRSVLRRGTDVIGIIEQSYRWNGNTLGDVTMRIRPSTAR